MKQSKRKSIESQILVICILPIIILGILLVAVCVQTIKSSIQDEVQNSLAGAVNMMKVALFSEALEEGRLSFKNERLYIDDRELKEFSFVDRFKEETGMDVTVFWGETRVFTSIFDESGERVVGTTASKEVTDKVLVAKQKYFSSDILIDKKPYFGYYIPMIDARGEAVGMLFAGKTSQQVNTTIYKAIGYCVIIALIVVIIAIIVCVRMINKIIEALICIKEYMRRVAKGDYNRGLDACVLERNDEIRDMGEIVVRMRKKIQRQIFRDPLTGLLNRRACYHHLDERINECKNGEGSSFSVAMLDIDFFKRINDEYGHDCGDMVLIELAQLLMTNLPLGSKVMRWGGEEFLMVLAGDADNVYPEVQKMADVIRKKKFPYDDTIINITVTIGIVTYELQKSADDNIRIADELLYHGKRNGRNQIVTYSGQ